MQLTDRLENAIRVAAWAHRSQVRKGTGVPYIVHPYGVMLVAQRATNDEDTLIACLFHDILEDVADQYSETSMRAEFGDKVTDIVKIVSKDDRISDWHDRSRAYLAMLSSSNNQAAMIVACADKIHNLKSTLIDYRKQGDNVWEIFSENKDAQLWWYQSVHDVIVEHSPDLVLLSELKELISQLKSIVGDE